MKAPAPEAHRLLADPEGLGDLAARPAQQGEQNRRGTVRLAAIPQTAQSQRPPAFALRPP